MNTLFERITTELAEADETTEVTRPSVAARLAAAPVESDGVVIEPNWPAPDISTQIDRPLAANRQCSRSGCSDAAAVTLSYHYGMSQVWIDRLWPERDPHMYDMCAPHAERLSVPRGWHLDDRRGASHTDLIAV